MKYVSPYYLAEKFEWQVEWLDQSKIIELRQKVASLDEVLFDYGHLKINAKDALDFLNNIGDPQSIQYCLWIHSVEPLEQLLHEGQIRSEKPLEISNEIKFSGQLAGLQQFVRPYLKASTLHAAKEIIDARKFDDYTKLNGVWQFFSDQRTIEDIKLELADYLIGFFDQQIEQDKLAEVNDLTFLQGFEIVDFINEWPFSDVKKEELLKRIKDWEPIFRGRADEGIVQSILTNLSHIEGLRFQLNFHQPKPDESYANMAIEEIRAKQKAEQDRNKKIGFAVLGVIGIIIIGLLITRARMLEDDQEIVGTKDKYGNVKYYVEDKSEDDDDYYSSSNDYEEEDSWWDIEGDEDEPAYSEYEWRQQLSVIRSFVNRNNSDEVNVSNVAEFATPEDMEAISNPFIEFFYPLHNKYGSTKHKIVNNSNYGCILLVKSTPDCYSYYVPSKSTYEEPFDFKEGDEIVFYLGKMFVETPDLLDLGANSAGFHYTNDVSKEQLRYSYRVTDVMHDDWDENRSIVITSHSTPGIDFRCNVKVRTYKDGRRY